MFCISSSPPSALTNRAEAPTYMHDSNTGSFRPGIRRVKLTSTSCSGSFAMAFAGVIAESLHHAAHATHSAHATHATHAFHAAAGATGAGCAGGFGFFDDDGVGSEEEGGDGR